MFAQILRTHWAWTRTIVLSVAVLVFMLPSLIWRLASSQMEGAPSALVLMDGFSAIGPMIASAAILGAFAFAAYPWGIDNETRHVYPLSLPITWTRYVSLRYAAGAILLLIPAIALWLGAIFVLSQIDLPAVLNAYPVTLALRFLIASLLAYSATFALQYLGGKSAALTAFFVLLGVLIPLLVLSALGQDRILDAITKMLINWPGPLAIFAEPWKLIDV